MKNNVYWKQADGTSISVDDMDENHLRNALKMLIRRHERVVKQANKIVDSYNKLVNKTHVKDANFTLKGDIAQMFNDTEIRDEFDTRNEWNPFDTI